MPRPGGRTVPLTRFVKEDALYDALRHVGERRFMDVVAGTPAAPQVIEDVACGCGLRLPAFAARLLQRAVLLSVTSFMDAQTVDLDRMDRCCIRVATRTGRLAPFCGYYLTDRAGKYKWRDAHYPEDTALPRVAPVPRR